MTVHGGRSGQAAHLLVTIDEVDVHLAPELDEPVDAVSGYSVLQAEVLRLQNQLHGTIDDSAASGEALRAANEELQSINEELRSATEELETSKEELQSVNEELTTVNFELKHKVEETAKVNDDLNNLITSMNIATVFVDRAVRIKGFTPLASRIFNILSGDVGRPLHDLTHRLHYDRLMDDVAEMLTTLRPVEREVSSTDGAWYLMRVSAYRTTEDRIDGAVINFIEVTELRTAREQVRARDERLRLVAESTKDYAMLTLDANGVVTGWNRGAELMFGYSSAEMIGEHFRRLFVPEDRAAGVPELELRHAKADGRALDERWHLRKDGSRFFCSGITTPMLEDGTEGFAKIARDLTERQLLERQREALLQDERQVRQQLEAAHAMRSEFLAVLSHELKNPLNLVMVSAELISRLPGMADEPQLMRAVDTIRRTVQAQSQIIDDLLDLSRLNTGKMALSRSAVQFRPIVERIAEALRQDVAERRLDLQVACEDLTVFADAVRVEQIVWNLASNALKFTPAGGRVSLRLSRDGNCALLEVEDTGRGIEPAFLPHVFEMFRQADGSSRSRRGGGLGIGLALVKSLAELQHGSVAAHSGGPGLGARFSVRLPLFHGWLGRLEDMPGDAGHPLAGRRVLLVDDDQDTLDAWSLLLQAKGALVDTATDGAEALALAGEADYDLVLSDIAMPGVDGLKFIAELRRRPRSRHWLAIATTGFGRPDDAEQARAAGFDQHLGKPLSLETLTQAYVRLTAGRGEA